MNVEQLMKETLSGSVVLPDFQRSFVWEPEPVRELLVSVLGDYFIGSMLVLEQFREDSPFALRFVEGAQEVNASIQKQSIVRILLDGQQRTSALFYALYEPKIPLKNRKNPYHFYLNIEKALSGQWDDAVIAVSIADRRRLGEVRRNKNIIPFSMLRDIGELAQKFRNHPNFNDVIKLANAFMHREIHMVDLPRETDLERIVETFERINRTGEPLSIFELLTARLWKHDIKLRPLLESTRRGYGFIDYVPPEFVLKVMVLLRQQEPKRKNILELDPKGFVEDWHRACNALQAAYERSIDIKNGYGVFDFGRWMPYTTMLVPLSAMIDFVKTEKMETKRNYDKVDQWYWVSVFSNRYDQAVDTTSMSDFAALKRWIRDDGEVPDFVHKFEAREVDLDVDKRSSAVYRGAINLVVLNGALDFRTGQPPQFDKERIQDDHIFPKSIFREHRMPNRTLISTNVEKSNERPSLYFKRLLTVHGEERFKRILHSHMIPDEAIDYIFKDDIQGFMEVRKQAIINNLCLRLGLRDEDGRSGTI